MQVEIKLVKNPFICVQAVSHEFRHSIGKRIRTTTVLDNINIDIQTQKFVCLLGPSGCGKTTLLRIIDGLLHPTRGSVMIDGKVVRGPSADRGMVFQDFGLLPWRTSQKNAEFGLEVQGRALKERRAKAEEALHRVGLNHFKAHFPHELSGGMKQRVGLARALCTGPNILLMDEPFGSLDPQTRELMQVDLMKLWEEDRKTVIFVTHSIDEAIFLSDQIVLMTSQPGKIRQVIDVDLPRPRWMQEQDIKISNKFIEYRRDIWKKVKEEIALSQEIK